jgi:acyl carrier protein
MKQTLEMYDGLIAWIRRRGNPKTRQNVEIGPETDILTTGILDSQGLIELLMFIEDEYGYELDLSEAEPADYSSVKALSNLALTTKR